MNNYVFIVVPVGNGYLCNTVANQVDNGKTSRTFTVGLSPTGKLPITHYWCCWWVNDKERSDLKKLFGGTTIGPTTIRCLFYDFNEDWTGKKILDATKLKMIESEELTILS